MVSDLELLDALGRRLDEAALSDFVGRMLRVPQAWDALHDPDLLGRFEDPAELAVLAPADLARDLLGWTEVPADLALPTSLQTRAESLWPESPAGLQPPADLVEVALLAVGLLRLAQSGGPQAVAQWVGAAPEAWVPPLACALGFQADPAPLIRALGDIGDDAGVVLAGRTLMAMGGAQQAALSLLTGLPNLGWTQLAALAEHGEPVLAQALAQKLTTRERGKLAAGAGDSLPDLTHRAVSLRVQGQTTAAFDALRQAWDASKRSAAEVADQMAEVAKAEGDLVTALEARRRAAEHQPTPLRKACLAIALADSGQAQAALEILGSRPITPQEQIAAGYALSRTGEHAPALGMLNAARDSLSRDRRSTGADWLRRLAKALHASGEVEGALNCLRSLLDATPADHRARLAYAELLGEAGDPHSGAQEASLVLALDPASRAARRVLAANLQATGQHPSARAHWTALGDEATPRLQVAACALAEGQADAAAEMARELLQEAAEFTDAKVLLARALAARGEREQAHALLAEVIQTSPTAVQAWIASSAVSEAAADPQAAEATLRRAAQALPDRAEIHAAWGALLRRQGRHSDAVRPLRLAASIEPANPRWALALGDLYRSLGNSAEALPLLRQAVVRLPRDTAAQVALAQALEDTGEIDQALKIVETLPANVSPAESAVAGRIMIRSARRHSAPGLAELGLKSLDRTLRHDPACRETLYWRSLGLELVGRPDDALQSYRACAQAASAPGDPLALPALIGIARSALALGDKGLARATLEAGRDDHPDSPDLLTALAETLLAQGSPQAALQAAEQAATLDPRSQEALLALRRAALASDRGDLALRALQRLVDLRPADSQTWMDLAETAWQAVDGDLVRTALAGALRTGRQLPAILRRAAALLRRLDDMPSAKSALRRAARLDPQNPGTLRLLAQAAEQTGDWEAAIQAWLTTAALEPGNAEPFVRAARALEALSRWNAACDVWEKAVELQPQSALLQAGLARAYQAGGRVRQALDAYAVSVTLDPADPDLVFEAGKATLSLGAAAEAADLLEKAAYLAPGRAEISMSLAECLFLLGRTSDCRQALDQSASKASPTARARAIRSLCCADEGDLPAALESFGQALVDSPAAADEARWLARAGLRLGRWEEAERVLRTALAAEQSGTDLPGFLVEARLQSLTAGWILSQIEAHAHARRAGLPDAGTLQTLQRDMAAPSASTDPASPSEPYQHLLAALRGELGIRELEGLAGDLAAGAEDGQVLPLALAHMLASRPAQAADVVQTLASRRPLSSLASLMLALTHVLQGKGSEARPLLDTVRQDPVLRPAADALEARTWLVEQDLDRAVESLNAAAAAWPDETVWQHQLATLYLQRGEVGSAIPHLQQVVETDPDNADAAWSLARALRQNGQLTEARQVYASAVGLVPDVSQVWKEAGETALAVGDGEQAEAWFERACTLDPSDGPSLIGAAHAALACGRARQAVERAQAAARLAPAEPEVLLGLGEIFDRLGRSGEALKSFDHALEVASDPIPVHLARGRLLVRLGRAAEAAQNLRRVLSESSANEGAWAALAEISEGTGDLETALQAASNAARIAPRNPAHHQALGHLARRSGQLDRALDELRQAEALGAADPRLPLEIGLVHEDRREDALALDAYERAMAADPRSAEAHFRAGVALKRLKAYSRAGRLLKKAVDLNPKDPEAHHQLAAVRALELVHGGLHQATVQP